MWTFWKGEESLSDFVDSCKLLPVALFTNSRGHFKRDFSRRAEILNSKINAFLSAFAQLSSKFKAYLRSARNKCILLV